MRSNIHLSRFMIRHNLVFFIYPRKYDWFGLLWPMSFDVEMGRGLGGEVVEDVKFEGKICWHTLKIWTPKFKIKRKYNFVSPLLFLLFIILWNFDDGRMQDPQSIPTSTIVNMLNKISHCDTFFVTHVFAPGYEN